MGSGGGVVIEYVEAEGDGSLLAIDYVTQEIPGVDTGWRAEGHPLRDGAAGEVVTVDWTVHYTCNGQPRATFVRTAALQCR